ncbi:hypothetical protein [Rathayibacter sp. AY1E4]|uniref:hypothetical protein n=1 Tax=Rathayibacter sp. AY1E4 TaxID=2080552 RepID=UPI000CE80FBA|nr:hypothetical protein [Rathayibacter sp. AY1E4]
MRSRGRAERRGGARPLLRGATAAIALLIAAGALTGCTPSAEGTQATPTLRETSIDVAAPPAYTAAREAGLALRNDSLALLTATDGTVAGAARTDLLVAIGSLNAALEGVSADAITTATTAAGEQRTALAERVLGLATSTLASGRGSTSRRAVLTDAVEQLRSALASGAAVAPLAVAVIEARGAGEERIRCPAPEPAPAPAPEPTEAPQPTAEPLPQPEPTAVLPPRTCADDPRLCTPAPEPTIGGPLT